MFKGNELQIDNLWVRFRCLAVFIEKQMPNYLFPQKKESRLCFSLSNTLPCK